MRKMISTLSVVTALLATAVIGVQANGMYGNWTATASAPNQSVAAATIGATLTTTMATNMTNMVAGDQATRYVNVANNANGVSWSKLGIRMKVGAIANDAGNPGGAATTALWASQSNVRVRIAQCTAGWSYGTGNPPTCTTWEAWTTLTLGSAAGTDWTGSTYTEYTTNLPAASASTGFKIEWAICAGSNSPTGTGCTALAATNLQGSTATYNTEFLATQRAGAVQ